MKSTAHPEVLEFIADMRALPDVVQAIRSAAAAAEINEATALRVELVLEELFTNAVVHGYAMTPMSANQTGRIWLQFLAKVPNGFHMPGSLHIKYRDAAIPFNPLQKAAEVAMEIETAIDVHQRRVGGLGCALIVNLADKIHYVYEQDKNCLEMTFYTRL